VRGFFLGAPLAAGLGGALGAAPACAGSMDGVVISEVLYDASGADDGREWVELFNGGADAVDLSGWSLGWGGTDYTSGQLALTGVIEPGAYWVVGGPESATENASPLFDDPVDLAPDLQNSGATADGVALFDLPPESVDASTLPISAVVYGETNESGLLDASGAAGPPQVGDAPGGASIELTAAGWRIQTEPTPGDGPLTAPEPGSRATAAAALAALFAHHRYRERRRRRASQVRASRAGAPAGASGTASNAR
jgi:hypothetical protein